MATPGNKTYRVTEVVGTSTISFEDGIKTAVARAQKTLRHLQWFEIKEQRGRISEAGVEYQVELKIGFLLEEETA